MKTPPDWITVRRRACMEIGAGARGNKGPPATQEGTDYEDDSRGSEDRPDPRLGRGVGYLSGMLKLKGHRTALIFDPMIKDKSEEFAARVKIINPDLIGFSVVTENYQWALNMAAVFKQNFATPIIFGGPHVTIMPQEVISNPQVDMVAVGESEKSLLELADSGLNRQDIKGIWFKQNGSVIRNSLRPLEPDIDQYPFPDEDLFYEQLPPSYRITPSVITSRGCPFSCTYCGNQIMQKVYRESGSASWVRRRSVENVLAELAWRKERHGSRHFVFMDDIFASDLEWLRRFIKEYKQKINLPFNCLAHPSLAKEETIALLKEGGCTFVDFGLQSGCSDIRKKVLYRYEKNEEVLAIAEVCKKHKLRFILDCILNLPFDTEETIKESLGLFNKARPDIVSCYSLAYLPRAQIMGISKGAGLLSEEDIGLIEEGRHPLRLSSVVRKHGKDDYRRYSFLFCSLPILPKWSVSMIVRSRLLFSLFTSMPLIFLALPRVIAKFKFGFRPVSRNLISNGIFYFKNYLFRRKKI